MKITYNYGPRQIGKTTKAIERYLQDPDNTAIVCVNSNQAKDISRLINPRCYDIHKNIFSAGVSSEARGKRYDTVIFDEFDFICTDRQHELLAAFQSCLNSGGEIIIYTTPSRLRDKELYESVVSAKSIFRDFREYKSVLPSCIGKEAIEKIQEMWYDIITTPGIVMNKMSTERFVSRYSKEQSFHNYGREMYTSEIAGQLFGPAWTHPHSHIINDDEEHMFRLEKFAKAVNARRMNMSKYCSNTLEAPEIKGVYLSLINNSYPIY